MGSEPTAGPGPDQAAEATPARGAATAGAEVLAAGLGLTGLQAAIAEPAAPADDDPAAGPAAPQPDEVMPHQPALAADGPQTVVAPVATTGVVPSAPAVPMTVGASAAAANSLPGYGSDLRAAATAPGAPQASAAAPGSASAGSAGTSAATGAPVVVRRGPAAKPERDSIAVSAAVGGVPPVAALSGPEPGSRLRRLLGSVARQRPQLCWAVGDLEDGSTVVVTDLAGGWIPPGIDIPAGVRLLPPSDRTGDVATLLGAATPRAVYQPGQHLPRADAEDRGQTSGQTWQSTPVDDLGWELVKATKWRDGLPRLAHTMARAASARSGYLGSEIDLLRMHLGTAAGTVLSGYPGSISAADLGNWQLLAATEALISGEKDRANYHFAWFLARTAAAQTAGAR